MSRRALSTATLAALGVTAWAVHRFARRSGVSRDEARLPLPGDDLVAQPWWVSTRAITIDAPPESVWPWVVQMGYPTHRAGWYTPHWLDELMWGERPRSADEIRPELQDLKVGDMVPDSDDWSAKYVVTEIEPPSHMVLHSTWHVFGPVKEVGLQLGVRAAPRGRAHAPLRARPGRLPPALDLPVRRIGRRSRRLGQRQRDVEGYQAARGGHAGGVIGANSIPSCGPRKNGEGPDESCSPGPSPFRPMGPARTGSSPAPAP